MEAVVEALSVVLQTLDSQGRTDKALLEAIKTMVAIIENLQQQIDLIRQDMRNGR